MVLGGTNGLTSFSKSLTQESRPILGMYLLTVGLLAAAYARCRWVVGSRLGRVLVAVRDKESRLYFAGYKPYAFKVFAFTLAAVLAAVGGMLYSPQVTIISPHNMRVKESILMVIWVALGGRGRLWGAVFGALLVNYTYAALTSDLPAVWPFVQGAMFLAVVLLFPGGIGRAVGPGKGRSGRRFGVAPRRGGGGAAGGAGAFRARRGTGADSKVYRSHDGRTSRQSVDAGVGAGAVLAVALDPVTCFAGARYGQRQHYRLDGGASLLL